MKIVGQEPGYHRVKNDPYTFKAPWSWSNLIFQIKKIRQWESKWLAEIIKLDKKEACKILFETCLFCEHVCGFVHRVGGQSTTWRIVSVLVPLCIMRGRGVAFSLVKFGRRCLYSLKWVLVLRFLIMQEI